MRKEEKDAIKRLVRLVIKENKELFEMLA